MNSDRFKSRSASRLGALLLGGIRSTAFAWLVLTIAGCDRYGSSDSDSLFLGEVVVRRNPNDSAPLAALVDFRTCEPVLAKVQIDDGERQWVYSPKAAPRTQHHVVLMGLRPGRTHHIQIQVAKSESQKFESSGPLTITTPPLPDDFPPINTLVSQPAKMEPGVTIFPASLWREDKVVMDYGYFIGLDERGEVVWYFRTEHRLGAFQILNNGHLLFNRANFLQVVEIDMLGNEVQKWHASRMFPVPDNTFTGVDADTLHHDVLELPSGNLLALSTELREVEAFPSSELDPDAPKETAVVTGDVIIEFVRDGTIVRHWSLFPLLDLNRIGYGSLSPFWEKKYDGVADGTRDWSHANAIYYDEPTDALIVSVRHQDCLIKIDRGSGEIYWILGDHGGWGDHWQPYLLKPEGNLNWQYHQHGAKLTPHGTILMFDNGNYQAVPFAPKKPPTENSSRVVEFKVDEKRMTVSQVWEYRGAEGKPFYSPFYGEADFLPATGNILVTDGGHIEFEDGSPSDIVPSEHQWARILEVTHSQPAEIVFEVVIESDRRTSLGWSVYRSQRVPELQSLAEHLESAELAKKQRNQRIGQALSKR